MNNFDDFFEQKLNEEQQFPNSGANWGKLSQQLQSHDLIVHTVARKVLVWKIAAAAALIGTIASTALLYQTRKENKQLEHTIAQYQQLEKMPSTPLAQIPAAPDTLSMAAPNAQQAVASNQIPVRPYASKSLAKAAKSLKTPELTPSGGTSTSSASKQTATAQAANQEIDTQTGRALSVNQEITAQTAALLAAQNQITQLQEQVDSLQKALTEAKASSVRPAIMATLALLPAYDRKTAQKPDRQPAAVAYQPKQIQPFKSSDRWRAGVQAQLGYVTPRATGVSGLKGSGFNVAYSPVRNWWLTASADWLHFNIQTDTVLKRLRLPDPPMMNPSHHYDQLEEISSSQRQQQYALGVRYVVPLRARLRPTLRVAHVWTHVAPATVTFRFKDTNHPGGPHQNDPDYFFIKTAAHTFGNTWRFGAGLERSLGRWGLQFTADYAKQFTARTKANNVIYLNAGLQYRIN